MSLNGERGFINKKDEVVVPIEYHGVYLFKDGFAQVIKSFKSGFVNEDGKLVIDTKYSFAGHFEGEFTSIKVDEKFGFINRKGEEFFFKKGKRLGAYNHNLYYQKYEDTIVFYTRSFNFLGDKKALVEKLKKVHGDDEYLNDYLTYINRLEKRMSI